MKDLSFFSSDGDFLLGIKIENAYLKTIISILYVYK